MKAAKPQRVAVPQPFPQLAQPSKGQPMFMPHPNELQKNANQRIAMGFPVNIMPPHMNPQTQQMHPNLPRVPPNGPMSMNNFNVSISPNKTK